ncbi:MAG: hypothetical protein LDL41_25000 [Coleofasciculus sp. S288]|nr:hypothetical protein [Coleofasciculus sp. S288]
MVLGHYKHAIARFTNRLDAEQALNVLKRVGVSTAQISILPQTSLGGDIEEELGGIKTSDGDEDNPQVAGTIVGILIGAIAGSLTGLGLLLLPEVGFVLLAGGSGTVLLSTLAGAGCGIASSGLIQACSCQKSSQDQAEVDCEGYPSREYLVMVEGTDREVLQAEAILRAGLRIS